MGDRLPDHMMFQYIMWHAMDSDPVWARMLDQISYQLPSGETWPKEQ